MLGEKYDQKYRLLFEGIAFVVLFLGLAGSAIAGIATLVSAGSEPSNILDEITKGFYIKLGLFYWLGGWLITFITSFSLYGLGELITDSRIRTVYAKQISTEK